MLAITPRWQHANCFIETGFDKALLIDFNYDTEPLSGRYPGSLGPMQLLHESRLNHLGKLMFQWMYWHVLLPGREIPGISPVMTMAGKKAHHQRLSTERTMMTTIEMAGIDRDPEGFLTDPGQWNEDVAETIAHEAGIAELTPRHWLVVNYMRDTYLTTGEAPSIRTLGKESGVQIKELYVLFPKGPAKLAARIGGIPKPHGCM